MRIVYTGLDKPMGDPMPNSAFHPRQGPNLRGLVKEAFVATVVVALSIGLIASSFSLITLLQVVRP